MIEKFTRDEITMCPCFSTDSFAVQYTENLENFNKMATTYRNCSKWKRFWMRKIHKLKKLLKFCPRSSRIDGSQQLYFDNELERRQNYENEQLEQKFLAMKDGGGYDADYENKINENKEYENLQYCDSYSYNPYEKQFSYGPIVDTQYWLTDNLNEKHKYYVYVPDTKQSVPVTLCATRITDGISYITYRPDVDIRDSSTTYTLTSSQMAQAQHPLVLSIV